MFRDLIPLLADPGAVTAIITQSGNGYEAGFAEEFWKPLREYWRDQDPQTDAAAGSIRRFLGRTLP
jgi:hypothetical protein